MKNKLDVRQGKRRRGRRRGWTSTCRFFVALVGEQLALSALLHATELTHAQTTRAESWVVYLLACMWTYLYLFWIEISRAVPWHVLAQAEEFKTALYLRKRNVVSRKERQRECNASV